jgi:hypothetical protein
MKNPQKIRHLHVVITNRLNEDLSREAMLGYKFEGDPRNWRGRGEVVNLLDTPAPRTPQPAALTHNPFALALADFDR